MITRWNRVCDRQSFLSVPLWKSPNHELIQLIFRDARNYKPLIRFYVIIRYFPRTPWRRTRGRTGGMTRGTRESRREKVKWTVTGSRWKTGDRDGENGDSGGSVGKIGKEREGEGGKRRQLEEGSSVIESTRYWQTVSQQIIGNANGTSLPVIVR